MDLRYHRSSFLVEHYVYGRKLRPFSLYHWDMLEALESPLAPGADATKATSADLGLAVAVCGSHWLDVLPFYKPTPSWKVPKARWGQKLKHYYYFRNPLAGFMELKYFEQYVNDHFSMPRLWVDKDTGPSDSGLSQAFMVCMALVRAGYPEKEAWMMPVDQAVWRYIGLQYHDGRDVDVMTTDEQDSEDLRKEVIDRLSAAGCHRGKPDPALPIVNLPCQGRLILQISRRDFFKVGVILDEETEDGRAFVLGLTADGNAYEPKLEVDQETSGYVEIVS